jgi:pimeloyl-ACP methyl ester carboxylesterase
MKAHRLPDVASNERDTRWSFYISCSWGRQDGGTGFSLWSPARKGGVELTDGLRAKCPRPASPLCAIFLKAVPVFVLALLGSSSAFAQESRFAPFDGIKIHYESYGSGDEALVFIHGWTCDLTFWRGQEPVYSTHRSLLIDLPGHGESDKPNTAYPSEFFARAIDAVLTDAQVDRVVLIGHSLGGGIAYTFVRLYPEKVKSLVLVDAYFSRPPPPPANAALFYYPQRARSLSGTQGRKNFLRQVDAMFSNRTPPALREQIRAKMLATPEYVRVAAVTSISRLPAPDPAETFALPALAVLSRVTPARAAPMRSIFPKLQIERWENYGHFLMMEDPERFNQTLERFLSANP